MGSMGTDQKIDQTAEDAENISGPSEAAAEHRGVTVLMADIVGSTDKMEALGPEAFAALLQGFHATCTRAVRRHGGLVAQYQGDGIICYFGYPHAAEDYAAHAVEAALEIVARLKDKIVEDNSVEARIGLSSGTVLLRSDGDHFGANAVGTCINRAARLEATADPNTVLICDDTRRLVGRRFQLRDLGAHRLAGFKTPQAIYQALRLRGGLTTRFDSLRGHFVGDLVGRQRELEKLEALFESAGRGGGQSVVISAPPGFGKSRLVQGFVQGELAKDAPSFVLQCSPEHTGTMLYPVISYLEWVAGAAPGDDNAARHAKVRRLVTHVWGLNETEVDLVLELVSPLGADGPVDGSESVTLRRERGLSLLADRVFGSVTGRGTFLVILEDAHWLDPTSARLLELLVERAPSHPALIVVTTRDEPPYGDGVPAAQLIRLSPLSDEDARDLARQVMGEDATQIEHLVQKSEGVPLFLQEYANLLRSREDGGGQSEEVPLSLAAIVQSKIDRLDPETRALVRAGSAMGRSFDPAFAARVVHQDAARADETRDTLNALNLAYPTPGGDGVERVTFHHALIRDAVYGSMPSGERGAAHSAIADAFLFMKGAMAVEDHVLASHLAKAGRHSEAAERYLGAGMSAAGKGAAAEALTHLEAGLNSVETLEAGPERDELELRLLAVQGPTLMVTRGPGNPDFGAVQARATELVERLDMLEDMLPVVFYSSEHSWAVADLDRAETMADAVLALDQHTPSDVAHMCGNLLKGLVQWHRGQNVLSYDSMGRVLARHDADLHKVLYNQFIKEFGVFSGFYQSLGSTVLGRYDEGRELADQAVVLSERMGFPHDRGFALLARFNTALMRGDIETTDSASRAALHFSAEQGYPEFIAMAQIAQGWCQAKDGAVAQGVALMEEGFGSWRQTGFTCWQSLFAALIAPFKIQLGQMTEAAELLQHYLTLIDATGEEQARAPLLLAQAGLLRARGEEATALLIAKEARTVALQQEAVLWQDQVKAEFPQLEER